MQLGAHASLLQGECRGRGHKTDEWAGQFTWEHVESLLRQVFCTASEIKPQETDALSALVEFAARRVGCAGGCSVLPK